MFISMTEPVFCGFFFGCHVATRILDKVLRTALVDVAKLNSMFLTQHHFCTVSKVLRTGVDTLVISSGCSMLNARHGYFYNDPPG